MRRARPGRWCRRHGPTSSDAPTHRNRTRRTARREREGPRHVDRVRPPPSPARPAPPDVAQDGDRSGRARFGGRRGSRTRHGLTGHRDPHRRWTLPREGATDRSRRRASRADGDTESPPSEWSPSTRPSGRRPGRRPPVPRTVRVERAPRDRRGPGDRVRPRVGPDDRSRAPRHPRRGPARTDSPPDPEVGVSSTSPARRPRSRAIGARPRRSPPPAGAMAAPERRGIDSRPLVPFVCTTPRGDA